jgi:arabinan endo-1,5-alpha-L-arabinosidase
MQQVSPPSSENAIKHVHDPCIIRQGAYYYIFSTGPGVLMRRSHDLVTWEFLGQVFPDKVPAWALAEHVALGAGHRVL